MVNSCPRGHKGVTGVEKGGAITLWGLGGHHGILGHDETQNGIVGSGEHCGGPGLAGATRML